MRKTKPQTRHDWITRIPKWALLCAFWITQGIVLYLAQALIYQSQSEVRTTVGNDYFYFLKSGFWGQWPSWEDYTELLIASEFAMVTGGAIAALTFAQMIFLLPVRQPGVTLGHGRSIRKSIAIAGLAIGILSFAIIMAVIRRGRITGGGSGFINNIPGNIYTVAAIIIGFGWLVATPVLIKFSQPGPKETVLARLAKKLFMGTIIEIALLIPLDVMVRRKTSCYCWAGTYWALTVCGFVGVFALGPAVFLPILSKRRKTWYGGHCGVCGYDMTGVLESPRCPECGTGWRASKPEMGSNSKKSDTIDQHSQST